MQYKHSKAAAVEAEVDEAGGACEEDVYFSDDEQEAAYQVGHGGSGGQDGYSNAWEVARQVGQNGGT